MPTFDPCPLPAPGCPHGRCLQPRPPVHGGSQCQPCPPAPQLCPAPLPGCRHLPACPPQRRSMPSYAGPGPSHAAPLAAGSGTGRAHGAPLRCPQPRSLQLRPPPSLGVAFSALLPSPFKTTSDFTSVSLFSKQFQECKYSFLENLISCLFWA